MTISIFTGCSHKEKVEYKFDILTLDKKELKLTKDNKFKFKNHPTQTYFESYKAEDISKIGYWAFNIPYSSKNIITGYEQDLNAHVVIIYLKNGTQYMFFLREKDDIQNILKTTGIELEIH